MCSLYLAVFFSAPVWATEENKDAPPGRDAPILDRHTSPDSSMMPSIQKIEDGVLRVGNIVVNKKQGYVLVQGEVNMQEGLVEYLACGMAGKLHESVLKLYSDPFHIQIALLLFGLEPGKTPLKHQGDNAIPQGDPIDIRVTWLDNDHKTITHRAEALLLNQKTGQTMTETHWIFTGSQIMDGKFMAQVEHSIAATYHDPYALIDHPLETGSDDTLYHANREILPPIETKIQFIITSCQEK